MEGGDHAVAAHVLVAKALGAHDAEQQLLQLWLREGRAVQSWCVQMREDDWATLRRHALARDLTCCCASPLGCYQ